MVQCSDIKSSPRHPGGNGEDAGKMIKRSHLVLNNLETESFSGLMIHLMTLETTSGLTDAEFNTLR